MATLHACYDNLKLAMLDALAAGERVSLLEAWLETLETLNESERMLADDLSPAYSGARLAKSLTGMAGRNVEGMEETGLC